MISRLTKKDPARQERQARRASFALSLQTGDDRFETEVELKRVERLGEAGNRAHALRILEDLRIKNREKTREVRGEHLKGVIGLRNVGAFLLPVAAFIANSFGILKAGWAVTTFASIGVSVGVLSVAAPLILLAIPTLLYVGHQSKNNGLFNAGLALAFATPLMTLFLAGISLPVVLPVMTAVFFPATFLGLLIFGKQMSPGKRFLTSFAFIHCPFLWSCSGISCNCLS